MKCPQFFLVLCKDGKLRPWVTGGDGSQPGRPSPEHDEVAGAAPLHSKGMLSQASAWHLVLFKWGRKGLVLIFITLSSEGN